MNLGIPSYTIAHGQHCRSSWTDEMVKICGTRYYPLLQSFYQFKGDNSAYIDTS